MTDPQKGQMFYLANISAWRVRRQTECPRMREIAERQRQAYDYVWTKLVWPGTPLLAGTAERYGY